MRQILLVRHAIAMEPHDFAGPDSGRPLTEEGISRMKKGARGLQKILGKWDAIASSPYLRAQQTAEILSTEFPGVKSFTWEQMAPGASAAKLCRHFNEHSQYSKIAFVGHQPSLGFFVSELLAGEGASFYAFKKGGAVLLEFSGPAEPGTSRLIWALNPSELRALG